MDLGNIHRTLEDSEFNSLHSSARKSFQTSCATRQLVGTELAREERVEHNAPTQTEAVIAPRKYVVCLRIRRHFYAIQK